jgi:hypothetical protein
MRAVLAAEAIARECALDVRHRDRVLWRLLRHSALDSTRQTLMSIARSNHVALPEALLDTGYCIEHMCCEEIELLVPALESP